MIATADDIFTKRVTVQDKPKAMKAPKADKQLKAFDVVQAFLAKMSDLADGKIVSLAQNQAPQRWEMYPELPTISQEKITITVVVKK